jgi:prepilin-type processing-associated H-X9-DG protein
VEILVVVVIIGVLAVILLPTLRRTMEEARSLNCEANLRQLGVAMVMYRVETKGWYAPASSADGNHRWHGARTASTDPYDPRKGPLAPYLDGGEVRKCPSFEPELAEGEYDSGRGCGGYGYNAQYVGGSPLPWPASLVPAKDPQIAVLSDTVMFADTALLEAKANGGYRLSEYPFVEAPFWEAHRNLPATPSTHFRHGGQAIVVFGDGRVVRMQPKRLMDGDSWFGTTEDYQKAYIGFLSDSNAIFDRR